ncbi:MAG TPA: guanylate kinase [Candidatus Dormibacteraeota bacterium]|nr:guanylate kinase [Candidatus Dormibacteraeota bacterium]
MSASRGLVFVISGPSGVGKDALIDRLLAKDPNLRRSVSFTTRQPRAGEKDGVDYSFVTRDKFDRLVAGDEMLEHASYDGNQYGTSRDRVTALRAAGNDAILKIDVKGAQQVRRRLPDATFIFLTPPSMAELVRRTAKRHTESAEERSARQMIAETEMKYATHYDHVVVNDDLERAVDEVLSIIRSVRARHT